MRACYDREVDAVYITVTEEAEHLPGPVISVPVAVPENMEGEVVLDFKYGRLIGIEVLGASITLPGDLLMSL